MLDISRNLNFSAENLLTTGAVTRPWGDASGPDLL